MFSTFYHLMATNKPLEEIFETEQSSWKNVSLYAHHHSALSKHWLITGSSARGKEGAWGIQRCVSSSLVYTTKWKDYAYSFMVRCLPGVRPSIQHPVPHTLKSSEMK